MTEPVSMVNGAVLCRVGPWRFAVDARDIGSIEDRNTGALYAGLAFDRTAAPAPSARRLLSEVAQVVVDTVEISSERVALLKVPGALATLASAAGGALLGFVELSGELWPLVSLGGLMRVLERSRS